MEIQAKIYFDNNGEVLRVIGERRGDVLKTTKEEDLQGVDVDVNDIDCIELEYGTFQETFKNAKHYRVDVLTKELKVEYFTEEELEEMKLQEEVSSESEPQQLQEENKRLIDQITDLKAEILLLKNKLIANGHNKEL